jgi:LysR family transcriptional regulator, hydrogen peroxide-inducible genes activator
MLEPGSRGSPFMELHQVRYFLKAGETLNFTRAAEQCGVSVPSLSRAIHQLEEELGGQLFRRERHLTHLTDLGRLMLQHFSTMIEAVEAAKRDASDYAKLSGTKLKLGIFASMGADVMTGYLATLRAEAPNLELYIWEANCEEIEDALLRGEVDMALSSVTHEDERIRTVPLFREFFYVIFPPEHRFSQMNAVPLRELEGEDYVQRVHCEFPQNLNRLGEKRPFNYVNLRYIGEREDWIQSLVRAGMGCAIMPEHIYLMPGIEMRKLIDPEVHRDISVATVAGRPHSAPVAAALAATRRNRWPNPAKPA